MQTASSSASDNHPFGDYDAPTIPLNLQTILLNNYQKLLSLPQSSNSVLKSPFQLLNEVNTTRNESVDEDNSPFQTSSSQNLNYKEEFRDSESLNSPGEGPSTLTPEEEKKRKKNTEAARRCREKIRKTTEELEKQLGDLLRENDTKNRRRIAFLSEIEQEISKLKQVVAQKPELKRKIFSDSNEIVQTYLTQVRDKRRRIDAQFEHTVDDDSF